MAAYLFRVISVVMPHEAAPKGSATMVEEFKLEIGRGIEWVREHADELAEKVSVRRPCALWIEGVK
jgi:hypothetical protein